MAACPQMERSQNQKAPDETRTFVGSSTTDDRAKSDIFFPPGDQNPTQFTFYRDSTPPPVDRARDTKERGPLAVPGLAGSGRGSSLESIEQGGAAGGDGGGVGSRDRTRICGIRKFVFWCIVAAISVVLIALVVGLGVGLGLRKKSSGSDPAPTAVGLGATGTLSATGTGVTASPTAQVSSTPSPTALASSECPDADGRTYNVPGTNKDFLILCGIDYTSSRGEAVELGQVEVESMADCIQACVNFPACTACGWGFIEGDTGDAFRCWLKGNLAQYHTARANWSFAILQPATGDGDG